MSAAALLEKAWQTGISLTVVDSKLRLAADDEPPAELVEAIVRQKTEIIALLREDSPKPDPAELEDNALAMDSVPERYLNAWARFQLQCPAGMDELRWRQATDDVGRFLDQWGKLADSFGWTPGDLFDVPRDGAGVGNQR